MSAASERRYTPRFKLHVPLVFCPVDTPTAWGHPAKSINISERGVYFRTTHPVFVGLPVRVLLAMPDRLNRRRAGECLFTGRVTHIERKTRYHGQKVGVEFFYSEPFNDTAAGMQAFATLLDKSKGMAASGARVKS